REAARVERDRLADEPEDGVAAGGARRVVAENDQPRLVRAALGNRGEGTHAELVDLRGPQCREGQVLVLARQALRVLGEQNGRQFVRRRVGEVARAVRPLRDERRAVGRRAQRSEERRVGKERRSRWALSYYERQSKIVALTLTEKSLALADL